MALYVDSYIEADPDPHGRTSGHDGAHHTGLHTGSQMETCADSYNEADFDSHESKLVHVGVSQTGEYNEESSVAGQTRIYQTVSFSWNFSEGIQK
jgi:hypothetical protein